MTVATSPVVQTFLELAAIPSPSRDERAAADYVIEYLNNLGLTTSEDDAAGKIPAGCGNITVSLPGTCEGTPIFLCSHLDTVTLEDEVVPVITDDGRITNKRRAILGGDNKAAVAVMLELVRELVDSGEEHAGLEVVFTPCEEIGLVGAKFYEVEQLAAKFGYVFDHGDDIGKIVTSAPTQMSYRATFKGVAAHSGIAPQAGKSAVRAAADALLRLDHGRIDEKTTANVGLIEGGSAVNIIPEYCMIRGEVRSLDSNHAAECAQQIHGHLLDAANEHHVDVDIDMHEEYRAYQFTEANPAVKLATAALSSAGYSPSYVPCGGGSDANIFNANGKTCVNLCNAMRKIHTSDEYMEIADLEGMLKVARQLVLHAKATQ